MSGFSHDLWRTYRSRIAYPTVVVVLLGLFVLPIVDAALPSSPTDPTSVELIAVVLGAVLPFVAAGGTNRDYARAKLQGLLEPILAQPITRGGLLASRFLGGLFAVLTPVVVVYGIQAGNHSFGPTGTMALGWVYFGLVVEFAFASGLVLLLAQVSRSQIAVTSGSSFLTFLLAILIPGLVWIAHAEIPVFPPLTEWLSSHYFVAPLSYGLAGYGIVFGGAPAAAPFIVVGISWALLPFLGAYAANRFAD